MFFFSGGKAYEMLEKEFANVYKCTPISWYENAYGIITSASLVNLLFPLPLFNLEKNRLEIKNSNAWETIHRYYDLRENIHDIAPGIQFSTTTMTLDSAGVAGPSPVQALGFAVAGCMTMDVAYILKKGRQPFRALRSHLIADRAQEEPHRVVRMHLQVTVEGDVPPDAVARALALSHENTARCGTRCGRTSCSPPRMTSSHRRAYVDWARGIAVLLMIEAHTSDAWTRLSPTVRRTVAFRDATVLGGFAAPLFLWLAGLAVVLAATRAAERTGSRRAAVEMIGRRGLEIFILGFLFRLQGFILHRAVIR